MINVRPRIGINDYIFGSEKSNDNPIMDKGFKLEYKLKKLVAISFKDTYELLVDGQTIDLTYDSDWLLQQNPYFDGNNFIFPEINMAVWGLEENSKGNEVTFYSDDIKDLYESEIDRCIRYNEFSSKGPVLTAPCIIEPYKGCGKILFGNNPGDIISRLGKPKKHLGNSTKSTLHWDDLILSFRDDRLIQLSFEQPFNLLLNNENIAINGDLSNQFNSVDKLVNRSYTVLFDYGMAFSGYSNSINPKTVILFDKLLIEFWSNTKRPLIL